jgi:ubiquinone/menaquinone biosynthesis C-methylase UbiE
MSMTTDTTTTTTRTTEQFCERLLEMYNGAAISLMISIGHRTGLFDTMANMMPASTDQIAAAARLDERYVREWLGAMAVGGIVDYDQATDSYWLPREHAAALTRAATPNNMASISQWFAVLGGVEDKIVERFRTGGGLCYKDYNRFHEVMAEESGQTTVAALMETILPIAPGMMERMTAGARVLDVGCGSGAALMEMARNFPASRFVGFDMCEEAVQAGKAEAARRGLTNVTLATADASKINAVGEFDMITAFDAIHDQARPDRVLKNIHRALKTDGVFLMQDIHSSSHVHGNMDNPLAPFIYTISCMHCMSVSLGQDGMGLGAAWGEELALSMLREAGFRNIDVRELSHDILNTYFVCRKDA